MNDRKTRTQEKLSEPDLLDTICSHVANGGSLVNLAELWDVRYSDILMWVYDKSQPGRKTAYERALEDRTEFEVDKILGELRRIASVDIREAYDDNGALRDIKNIPSNVAACIQSIEVFEEFQGRGDDRELIGYTKKVKFWDKIKAIDMLGKKLALFINRTELSGKVTLEDLIGNTGKSEAKSDD